MHKKIFVNTDGGSRGNPGDAAIGITIRNDKEYLKKHKERIGKATNNVAEYKGLIKGLEMAKDFGHEVIVFMDSELVVRQMNGEYSVRHKDLLPLFTIAKQLEKNFRKVEYKHVRREDKFQSMADELVNEALDER